VQNEIEKILANHSDTNSYGAANQAEFFAAGSEIFFERPDL
jgi:Mlc titration factor MtfA (ptsG expression regulator)